MRLKRFLRQPNTGYVSSFLLVFGVILCLLISNLTFKLLGLLITLTGLVLLVTVTHDTTNMFWRSHYEWWEDGDGNLEAWEKGEL